jgi:hypothetical protein
MIAAGSSLLQPGMCTAGLKKPGSASRVGSGRMPLICFVYLPHHVDHLLLKPHMSGFPSRFAGRQVRFCSCASMRLRKYCCQHSRRRDGIAIASAAEGIPRHLQWKVLLGKRQSFAGAGGFACTAALESSYHPAGLTVKTLLSIGCRLPRNMWTIRPCSCFCIESPTTSSRVLVLCKCCSTCSQAEQPQMTLETHCRMTPCVRI